MLTDSHCHLASHRFAADEVSEVMRRAREAGVARVVTLATGWDDVAANLAHAQQPGVHACVGIHPCDVHHAPPDAVSRLSSFAHDPRVCGIGETGLDYYHPAPEGWTEASFRECQHASLHRHFAAAAAAGLNLVIHTRDRSGQASFDDALAVYRDYQNHVRAVFHCFVGPWCNAERVLELGGLLGFGGVVTFKNARDARDSAQRCPAGSFMVETDAPYLAPEPHRGHRNEPAYVRHTAEYLATLRGEPYAQLAQHTGDTAAGFFRFRCSPNE